MPPPDSTKIAVDRSMWGVRLENSERSVNTVRRVLTAPVVARPRGDFRGDRPEGRRQPVPDRLERPQRFPVFATCRPITSVVYAAGRRRRRRTAASVGRGRLSTDAWQVVRDRAALAGQLQAMLRDIG